MKTFKKIVAFTLAAVMVAAVSVGTTVAYLQDDDSDVNVMTLGNVDIEQIEKEWNDDKTALQDFTQAKPLYPYVGTFGWEYPTSVTRDVDAATLVKAYRRFTMENVVDKYVTVKNIGKSDAYVRTFIALEMGEYTYAEFNMVGISNNAANGAEFQFPGTWIWTDDFVAEIDGKNYNVMVAVHENPLKPGEETIPSLLQVYLSKDAGNEEVEKLDGNDNGTYDILVFSEAVQTAGFADAETALNTAFGNTTVDKYHPWTGEDVPKFPVLVDDVDDMREAMKTPGAKIILSEDIVIDDDKGTGYALYAKYDCEIDLNGNDIKVNLPGKIFNGVIYALNGAKVDIVGEGNVEVNGGVGQFVWCTGANGETEVNIYGGNWVQDSSDFTYDDDDYYCEGIYANREGVINVYGGTFVNFDPSVSHDSDGSYVADGYKVVSESQANGDIWYTVVAE